MLLWLVLLLPAFSSAQRSEPMFSAVTKTALPPDYDNNPTQLNYGVAVTDVDGDGDLEVFVAGYNGPNLVLKYDKQKKRLVNIAVDNRSSPFYALRDRQGNAIGVTACDIDGDGREEIYVLNTNNAFSGRATYSDKLFKFRNGRFEDLLNDDINEHRDVANRMAGRSVACVDRKVRMLLWLVLLLPAFSSAQRSEPMFSAVTKTALPPDYDNNPTQLNYGVAVTDVDGDGDLEVFVAGYNGPNLVLKYDKQKKRLVNIAVDNRSSPFYALRDRQGNAIGVTACDIDGDGREEIYVLNTNNAFSGRATYSDKLFKFRNGRFEDLLNDDINEHRDVANRMAGRSVACVDRKGTGRYAIYIANYASGNVGPHALIEMDEAASDLSQGVVALSNVAEQAGVSKFTGGRGVVVGPIVSQTLSDVFCDNEYGPNFLFRNNGDGTFTDVAQQAGVEDPMQHGRGVALADFNRDGKTDIVYGNWNGPHRLYMQLNNRKQKFKDIASQKFSMPSPVRTVIAADFDNDNELEVFFNNIAYRGPSANRLFRVSRREHGDPQIEELNIGEASEPEGRGTGAVATDFDGDGRLELLVSHGESAAQPLSVYKVNQGTTNSWLRVIPRTKFGAFARGAKVVVYTKKSGPHTRIIDGGSGYLCEMEPVAHFGLGKDMATNVEVFWPDGRSVARPLEPSDINSVLEIHYPRDEEEVTPTVEIECGHGFALNENGRCTDEDECTQFPSVCPSDRPVCTNTYGSYKCRAKRRCNQGFEPNDDGSACVAQVAYFGGTRSSGERKWPGLSFWLLSVSVLPLISGHLQTGLL